MYQLCKFSVKADIAKKEHLLSQEIAARRASGVVALGLLADLAELNQKISNINFSQDQKDEIAKSLAALAVSGPGRSTKVQNAFAWLDVAGFLVDQNLARFGLKRVARKGPACGKAPREAYPVGNTGITSTLEVGAA